MPLEKHKIGSIESINIILSQEKFPIAYQAKKQELIHSGMSEKEAENFINHTPIELEIYYEPNLGLFAVESEAVENCDIFSPYTSELMRESEKSDFLIKNHMQQTELLTVGELLLISAIRLSKGHS